MVAPLTFSDENWLEARFLTELYAVKFCSLRRALLKYTKKEQCNCSLQGIGNSKGYQILNR